MKAFDYAIAEDRAQALAAVGAGWKAKGGGIDLLDLLKERNQPAPEALVALHRVDDLRGVEADGEGLSIGPLTTLRELGEHELVRKLFPALAEAAGHAATPQIRAAATVGGNLCQRPRCWYFRSRDYNCLKKGGGTCFAVEGDNTFHSLFDAGSCHIVHPSNIAPALVAAGAELDLESAGGKRTLPIAKFFVSASDDVTRENVLKPEELIVRVRVPQAPEKSGHVEIRHKESFDWPLAMCSAVYLDGTWSVVMGAVASIPRRAVKAEEVLKGVSSIDEALAEKAAEAALAGAHPMSRNAWRLQLAKAAVRRALLKADGKEVA